MKQLAKLFGALSRAFSNMGAWFRFTKRATPATRSTPSASPTLGNRSPEPAPAPLPRPVPLPKYRNVVQIGNRLYFREWHGQLWRITGPCADSRLLQVGRRLTRFADDSAARVGKRITFA